MTAPSPVQKMLERYSCKTNDERRDALKEIVQEITLAALDRAHFFTNAAFYGGTALRIFHGLERFSEDLDFSLVTGNSNFSLEKYLRSIENELAAYGFEMTVSQKHKTARSVIQSAFIKGGTLIHLIKICSITPPVAGVPQNELLKIKLEVDVDPPPGATYETKYRLAPTPYSVRLYDKPSLFAGKLHALLCRSWKNRVKGRDFFDYLWYLQNGVPLNIVHFEARMRQSRAWNSGSTITRDDALHLLDKRFSSVNFEQAKSDALPFVKDTRSLELWSRAFFMSVSEDMLKFG